MLDLTPTEGEWMVGHIILIAILIAGAVALLGPWVPWKWCAILVGVGGGFWISDILSTPSLPEEYDSTWFGLRRPEDK